MMGALKGRNVLQTLLETSDKFRQKSLWSNTYTAGLTYPRGTPGRSRVQPRAPVTYAGTQAGTALVPPGLSSCPAVSTHVQAGGTWLSTGGTWRNQPSALGWLNLTRSVRRSISIAYDH